MITLDSFVIYDKFMIGNLLCITTFGSLNTKCSLVEGTINGTIAPYLSSLPSVYEGKYIWIVCSQLLIAQLLSKALICYLWQNLDQDCNLFYIFIERCSKWNNLTTCVNEGKYISGSHIVRLISWLEIWFVFTNLF